MDRFLHITTVFDEENNRTIEYLSELYNDKDSLQGLISESIHSGLSKNEIAGKTVLLKPNWVKHSYYPDDEICLRTHDNFLLATLEIILKCKPTKVIIGDAPIQGCRWDEVVHEQLKWQVNEQSKQYQIPVSVRDFRRRTYQVSGNNPESGIRSLSEYVIFDLGKDSYLEEITTNNNNFRVTNYDPERMSTAHSPGVHKYCIAKEFFESDIVISLPKVKTHQKAGITGAIKNLVGINGDKDFLPHHRIGGKNMGGDCYPGKSPLRYWSELALDKANRRQGTKQFWMWQKLSSLLWKLSLPQQEHQMAAGWYGNDTTWRMVMDLNKVGEYGRIDGTLSKDKCRRIYSLCDGIVGGQGDGPLEPQPLALGAISFTNNSFLNDRAMAVLMELDTNKIPLLAREYEGDKEGNSILTINGKRSTLKDLCAYSIKAKPPIGWERHLNNIL
ncbi:DUF362 domain-containing protein [Saccharicrinis sp. 156]|uniref:DUF362 domain-containing protein n=1 Tax=Saccharicrinis sp. 156 TaxID=3417574 RepID=UPI003D3545D9